jgi:hypothetical protein
VPEHGRIERRFCWRQRHRSAGPGRRQGERDHGRASRQPARLSPRCRLRDLHHRHLVARALKSGDDRGCQLGELAAVLPAGKQVHIAAWPRPRTRRPVPARTARLPRGRSALSARAAVPSPVAHAVAVTRLISAKTGKVCSHALRSWDGSHSSAHSRRRTLSSRYAYRSCGPAASIRTARYRSTTRPGASRS